MLKKSDYGKKNNIEFLRFLFSVIIVYYHVLHANIIPYTGDQQRYLELQNLCEWASVTVECFLIIGGYFLYQSQKKRVQEPFIQTFLDRLVRLWPVYAFYVSVSLFFFRMNKESALFQLMFLHCTGISLEGKGIIWYIAPYFWATILLTAVLKVFPKRVSVLIISLIAYLGYALNINYTHGGFGRDIVFTFVSLGFIRVLSGLALGIIIAVVMESFQSHFGNLSDNKYIAKILFTLIEVFSLLFLLKKLVWGKGSLTNAFTLVIIFCMLFVSFLLGDGIIGKLLERPVCGAAGKYSYSIYVMQQISFYLMARTFWRNTSFLYDHVYLSLLASVVFSVFIGVLTYYLIEQPCLRMYKHWKSFH